MHERRQVLRGAMRRVKQKGVRRVASFYGNSFNREPQATACFRDRREDRDDDAPCTVACGSRLNELGLP